MLSKELQGAAPGPLLKPLVDLSLELLYQECLVRFKETYGLPRLLRRTPQGRDVRWWGEEPAPWEVTLKLEAGRRPCVYVEVRHGARGELHTFPPRHRLGSEALLELTKSILAGTYNPPWGGSP